jgi:hypothetical protein
MAGPAALDVSRTGANLWVGYAPESYLYFQVAERVALA